MSQRARLAPVMAVLVATMLGVACTGGDGDAQAATDAVAVEVFTNYTGEDATAFRGVLEAFTEQTGVPTRHIGTSALAERLPQRIRDGDPPDVAMVPQPALLAELAADGQTVPVDDLPADIADTMLPGTADIGMVDDRRHGVWFRVSVKSLLWYSPTGLGDLGERVPDTLDALLAQTTRLADAGATPWCVGMEALDATGWVGTDWIEDLVIRLHGPEVYDDWVAGEIPFTDPRIEEAFEAFGDIVLLPGSVHGGRRAVLGVPALEAIDGMLQDPPACVFTRQGSFQEATLPPDTTIGDDGDVAVTLLPGRGDEVPPIIAAGEIATTFNDDPGTQALLAYLASPAAGAAWAALSDGFISPHAAVTGQDYRSDLDRQLAATLAEAEAIRFDGSDQMPTAVGTGTFWAGIVDYAAGAPLPDVLTDIQAGYTDAASE